MVYLVNTVKTQTGNDLINLILGKRSDIGTLRYKSKKWTEAFLFNQGMAIGNGLIRNAFGC